MSLRIGILLISSLIVQICKSQAQTSTNDDYQYFLQLFQAKKYKQSLPLIQAINEHTPPTDTAKINILDNLWHNTSVLGQIDRLLPIAEQLVDVSKAHNLSLAKAYRLLGRTHSYLGEPEKSIQAYEQMMVHSKNKCQDCIWLSKAKREANDPITALSVIEQYCGTLDILHLMGDQRSKAASILSTTYNYLNEEDKALQVLLSEYNSIEETEAQSLGTAQLLYNIAIGHSRIGQYDMSSFYLLKSQKMFSQLLDSGHFVFGILNNELAHNSIVNRDFVKADSLVKKTFALWEHHTPPTVHLFVPHDYKSQIESHLGNYSNAIESALNARQHLHPSQSPYLYLDIYEYIATAYYELRQMDQFHNYRDSISMLFDKMNYRNFGLQDAQFELAKVRMDMLSYLSKDSHNHCSSEELIITYLAVCLGHFDNVLLRSERIKISQQFLDDWELLLEVVNSVSWSNNGLLLKLLEARKLAKKMGDIEDVNPELFEEYPLLKDLQNLRRQIIASKKSLLVEENKSSPNLELVELQEEYAAIVKSIRENSNYKEVIGDIVFDHDVLKIESVQSKIENGEAILEYAFSDSLLVVLYIDSKNSQNKIIPLSHEIRRSIEIYRSCYSNNESVHERELSNKPLTISDWSAASKQLSEALLGGFDLKNIQKLVVIRDQELLDISFGAMTLADQNVLDQYLAETKEISYDYSIYRHLQRDTKRGHLRNYVGFAPSRSMQAEDFLNAERGPEGILLFNINEVLFGKKLFSGQDFIANEATLDNFKEFAPKSNIIHVAAHSHSNDSIGDLSFLSFYKDSVNFDRLYSIDIQNMELAANLVILSACNSANGQLRLGEGYFGVAESFLDAGCSNVLCTVSPVRDIDAYRFITKFLSQFSGSLTPSVALQRTQLEFINSSKYSHPRYWSPYILIAESSHPVAKDRNHLSLLLLAGILILALFAVIVLTKKIIKV